MSIARNAWSMRVTPNSNLEKRRRGCYFSSHILGTEATAASQTKQKFLSFSEVFINMGPYVPVVVALFTGVVGLVSASTFVTVSFLSTHRELCGCCCVSKNLPSSFIVPPFHPITLP